MFSLPLPLGGGGYRWGRDEFHLPDLKGIQARRFVTKVVG